MEADAKRQKVKGGTLNPRRDFVEVERCVFCGGRDLNGEHLFPDWLRHSFDRSQGEYTSRHSYSKEYGVADVTYSKKRDQMTEKLNVVCIDCNGGWMHDIQEAARPVIEPLVCGLPLALGKSDIEILSTWMTMASMVGEYYEPYKKLVAVTQEERDWFMRHREPMRHWDFWIARLPNSDQRLHRHTACRVVPYDSIEEPHDDPSGDSNAQCTTFFIGHLFIHAFSCVPLAHYEVGHALSTRRLVPGGKIGFPFRA